MAGGALIQIVSLGSQDSYLTSSASITFWRSIYRRHSLFATEPIAQSATGSTTFGGKMTVLLSRNGDLLYKTYIVFNMPVIQTLKFNATQTNPTGVDGQRVVWCNELGYSMIQDISLEIGGTRFDGCDGLMLSVYHELAVPEEKQEGLNTLVGKIPDSKLRHPTVIFSASPGDASTSIKDPLASSENGINALDQDYSPWLTENQLTNEVSELHVPLHTMFFTRTPGNAIPLVALMYHECRLQIQLSSIDQVVRKYTIPSPAKFGTRATLGPASPSEYALVGNLEVTVWSDYCYLEQEERSRVAQMQHEILFEQVQEQRNENVSYAMSADPKNGRTTVQKVKVLFNHPCKFFAWVAIPSHPQYFSSPFVCSRFPDNSYKLVNPAPFIDAKITMNQHDRVVTRSAIYYTKVQPYQCAPRVPDHLRPIALYSFALNAFDTQPSGTVNCSRVDSTQLQITYAGFPGSGHDGSTENLDSQVQSWITAPPNATNFYGERELCVLTMSYNIFKCSSGMAGVSFAN